MKGRSKREAGGGVNAAEKDIAMKPERRNNAAKIFSEAEARKHGGKVKGEKAMAHAGRKPRKSGGRAGCEASPFTSAMHGTPAKGRKVEKMTMGSNV